MKEKNILDDLIEINKDRVAGYLKTTEQVDDPRLKNLFAAKVAQSRLFIDQLKQRASTAVQSPEERNNGRGQIYRTWMNLRATFDGSDAQTALECCEYGEDATLRAYDKALEHNIDLPLRSLLIEQENGLRQSHAEVRSLRDKELARR